MKEEDVKVGVKVRTKRSYCGSYGNCPSGSVVTVKDNDNLHLAEGENGERGLFYAGELEPAEREFAVGDVVELVEDYDPMGDRSYTYAKGMKIIIERIACFDEILCNFDDKTWWVSGKEIRLVTPAQADRMASYEDNQKYLSQNTFKDTFDLRGAALPTLCVEDGKIYESRGEAVKHIPAVKKVSPLAGPLNSFMDRWCRPE